MFQDLPLLTGFSNFSILQNVGDNFVNNTHGNIDPFRDITNAVTVHSRFSVSTLRLTGSLPFPCLLPTVVKHYRPSCHSTQQNSAKSIRTRSDDEAHFWLNGYVNKQNCRIWSEANPQVYVETPLHPEKLTVWCALWAGGILLQKR
ncbi:hypothetical protein TNCV_4736911 [Trichonephila clavipes]|nr:hypothetical protein TNCV_4736911 [Trichonephila clavipes]